MVSGPVSDRLFSYKFKIRYMYAFSKQVNKAYIIIIGNYLIQTLRKSTGFSLFFPCMYCMC